MLAESGELWLRVWSSEIFAFDSAIKARSATWWSGTSPIDSDVAAILTRSAISASLSLWYLK